LKLSWSSVATFFENVKNNPPIYRQLGNDGNHNEILLRLPYIGPVTLDTFVFASSALIFRIYLYWRGLALQRSKPHNQHSSLSNDAPGKSTPVKAKRVVGFQDASLQKTMQECQDVKQRLRKVQDPELARKQRQRDLKYNTKNVGFLRMSQSSLQKARKDLKKVVRKSQ
jgi:hypothetical protein